MVKPTHTTQNFTDQGGNNMVVGGTITVQRGGAIIQPQSFATNGAFFPTATVASGNFVRHYRVPLFVSKTSGGRNFVLYFPNFLMSNSTGIDTATCNYTKVLTKVALYYNGVAYDVTFNNSNGYGNGSGGTAIPVGAIAQSDPVEFYAPAGAVLYCVIREQSLSGTGTYLLSHYGPAQLSCGTYASQNTALNFTFTTPTSLGSGGIIAQNVSGGAQATPTIVAAGSGYTAGNAIVYSTVGSGAVVPITVNGSGGISGFGTITGGSGYVQNAAGFVAPTTANNTFQPGAAYGPCMVLYTPDVQTESLLLAGDSLTNGYNSADSFGDSLYNFGSIERVIAGRYGTVHLSMPGFTTANLATAFNTILPIVGPFATKTHLWVGTNDFQTNTALTAVNVATSVSALATTLRSYPNNLVAIQKLVPRTTSTDGFATTVNQTPITNFASGGYVDNFNSYVAAGWGGADTHGLNSDWVPFDMRAAVQDATLNDRWRVDQGVFTSDGIHPNLLVGLPYVAANNSMPVFGSLSGPHVAPGGVFY